MPSGPVSGLCWWWPLSYSPNVARQESRPASSPLNFQFLKRNQQSGLLWHFPNLKLITKKKKKKKKNKTNKKPCVRETKKPTHIGSQINTLYICGSDKLWSPFRGSLCRKWNGHSSHGDVPCLKLWNPKWITWLTSELWGSGQILAPFGDTIFLCCNEEPECLWGCRDKSNTYWAPGICQGPSWIIPFVLAGVVLRNRTMSR